MSYITAKEVKKRIGITSQTLNNYRRQEKIKYQEINSRNFLYDINSLIMSKPKVKESVIYCRVSNTKQKDDLIKQEKILREFVASKGIIVEKIYKDIASGMYEDRKGFNSLIKEVQDGNIDTVYISYKDRLIGLDITI